MLVELSTKYYILFNVNRISLWYLSKNEASGYVYFNNAHREKLCFTKSST